MTLSNFSNTVAGETVSLSMDGYTVSFVSTGDGDQAGNAAALKAALDSRGMPSVFQWKLDDAGTGVIFSRTDHNYVRLDSLTMSGTGVPSIDLTRGGDVTGTSGTYTSALQGMVQTQNIGTFTGTSGEAISFKLSGVPVSYNSAGSGNDATNSANLKAALDGNAAALEALGYSWNLSGSELQLTRSGYDIRVTEFTGSATEPSSFKLGSSTVAEGHSFYLTGFNNVTAETVSFSLGGVNVSYTAAAAGDQAANAAALYAALTETSTAAALSAAGIATEYDGSSGQVRIIKNGNGYVAVQNYSATDVANSSMQIVAETNSNIGTRTVNEGSSHYAGAYHGDSGVTYSSRDYEFAWRDSDDNYASVISSVNQSSEVYEPADFMTITSKYSGGGTIGEGGEVNIEDLGVIQDIELDEVGGLEAAFRILDRAMIYVADERAKVGAFMNQMEHKLSVLQQEQVNATAARSHILDTDYALESGKLAKENILQQAGSSMLPKIHQLMQEQVSMVLKSIPA